MDLSRKGSKPRILVVDDEAIVINSIANTLNDDYTILAATSGRIALGLASRVPCPDLILLDIIMPDLTGYNVLTQLSKNPITQHIPVILITSLDDRTNEEHGLVLGAVDFLRKPLHPSIVKARVDTHIALKNAREALANQNKILEQEVESRLLENELIQQVTVRALAHLAEIRDPETGNHILRTQKYVELLCNYLSKKAEYQDELTSASIPLLIKSTPLHDIGKVGIPDHILLKNGKLDATEWEVMKTHPALGARALEKAETDVKQEVPFLKHAKEIAHWHHEKWDGSGYPDGLKNTEIPLSARIMAVADVFDALTTKRVYKPKIDLGTAKEMIVADKGTHFDPAIIDAFLDLYDDFVDVARNYQD